MADIKVLNAVSGTVEGAVIINTELTNPTYRGPAGENGKDYILTETDKEEIADLIPVPDVDLSDYYTKEETDALIPDTSGFATEDYVDEKFNSIEIPEGQSGVYVGVEEPTDDSVVWINPEGDDTTVLITKEYVDEAIAAIDFPETDLSNYYTKEETDALIPSTSGLATEKYVDNAVKNIDLSNYAKKTDIPDTSGFTTMSAVEAKGYQTEAQVNSLINTALGVIENGTY